MTHDVGTRICLNSALYITNPTKDMSDWAEKNLRLDNPEYTRRVRMGKWTGNTPRYIYLYSTEGQFLVLPYGTLQYLNQEPFMDYPRVSCFKPAEKVDYNGVVPLYDYQERAVEEALKARYGILQAPAGSGKTQMGISLIMKLGKRALWLCNKGDLLKQSKDRALRYMDKSLIGTITAGKVNIGTGVTFATVQTMVHMDLTQYRDYWDVIIVDECHSCQGAPSVVTMYSKVLGNLAARHKYGLSATVHRSDGMIRATYALLGPVFYRVPPEDVADKIMRVTVQPVDTRVGMDARCLSSDGMLDYAKLIDYLCTNKMRNQLIVELISENRGTSGLILSDRLEHLEDIMSMLLPEDRATAAMISGKMTSKTARAEREAIIERMRTGELKTLFATYSLAKEGLDIPILSRLYMATPQADYAVVTQSIGRIARVHPDKPEPVCYDLVDSMPFLIKRYKKRCTSYHKANCIMK